MNFKTTLILLAVIGALVAAVFLIPDQKDPIGPGHTELLFPGFSEADVERIEISRPGNVAVTLLRSGDGWRMPVGDTEVRAETDRVRDVLDPFEDMLPRRTLGQASPGKLREYGFVEDNQVLVRLHGKDGATHELCLGGPTAQRTGTVYARAGEDGPVVVISDTIWSATLLPVFEYRDREPVGLHSYQVAALAVTRDGGEGFRASFDAEEQIWTLTRVAKDRQRALGRGDMETIEALRLAASELSVAGAEGFVTDAPTGEELASHGLSEPAFRIALTPREGGAVRTLCVGNQEVEDEEAVVFWCIEGEPSIYRSRLPVEPDRGDGHGLLDLLASPVDRFRDRSLLRLDAYAKAEELTLVTGGNRIHLKMRENEDQALHWRIEEPDVKGWAQDEVVDKFVADLKTLEIAAYADDTVVEDAGLGEGDAPTATLEIRMVGDEEARIFTLGSEVEGQGHHLRRGADALLVVAPPELMEMIRGPWFRFRHRELKRVSRAMARRIEVERAGVREIVVRKESDWVLPEGAEGTVDIEAVQDMLAAFEPVRAVEPPGVGFVAQGTVDAALDQAAWGLASPAVTVRITYETDEKEQGKKEAAVTLIAGTAVDGLHHARTEGAGAIQDSLVFVLSERAWQAVKQPLIND